MIKIKKKKAPKPPRLKRIKMAALNVAAHPHPPNAYRIMLEAADRENIKVHYFGNKYAAVGDLNNITKNIKSETSGIEIEHQVISGNLKTYRNFDDKKKWLNTSSKKIADDTEQEAVKTALQDWRPEHVDIPFLFYVNEHIVVIDITKFSIRHAQVILTNLFKHKDIRNTTDPPVEYVEVTAIPDEQTIENILAYPTLKYIKIVLTRMNGDDHGDLIKSFDDSLRRYHAKKGIIELFAEPASSLEIDEYHATSAREASTNGFVEAKGIDKDGHPQSTSTRLTPKIEVTRYNPKEKNVEVVMFESLVKFSQGLL